MKITNKTKNTLIAEEVIIADTPFTRMKGLLGRKDFKQKEALIIKPCNSIHTFFMHFAIDVMFVDARNRIVKIIPDFPPFRISGIYLKANFAVELPAGTLSLSSTESADSIELL